jgi:hypothetical protein
MQQLYTVLATIETTEGSTAFPAVKGVTEAEVAQMHHEMMDYLRATPGNTLTWKVVADR